MPMLRVNNLSAFYDRTQVLHEINVRVEEREIVGLVGANGAGKTTTLHHRPQDPHRRRNLAERRAHRPIASVRASSAGDRPDPRTTAAISVYDRPRKPRARSLSARAARGPQRQPRSGFRS